MDYLLICLIFKDWLTSSFIKSFFVQLNRTADLTCGLQPPSLKNTVEEQSTVVRWPACVTEQTHNIRILFRGFVLWRRLCGGKFRGHHAQTPRKKSVPTRCRWEAARRCFFARAPRSLHGFAKFQLQITKFGLPQKLYVACSSWNFKF